MVDESPEITRTARAQVDVSIVGAADTAPSIRQHAVLGGEVRCTVRLNDVHLVASVTTYFDSEHDTHYILLCLGRV